MMLEHLLYSAAIAIPISFALRSCIEPRHSVAIILGSAFSPDIFKIIMLGLPIVSLHTVVLTRKSFIYLFNEYSHSLGALLIYSLLIGFILSLIRWKFPTLVVCAGIGYGAHLFADALVYPYGYAYFWPLSPATNGFSLFPPYRLNLLGVANDTVLLVGLGFLLIAFIVRKYARPIQRE